jgi:hypothetical protein
MDYRALDQTRGEIRLLAITRTEAPLATPPTLQEEYLLDPDTVRSKLHYLPLENWRSNSRDDELTEVPLYSGRFIALSYMWGSREDLHTVYVDDIAVPVHRNLKKALKALRKTYFIETGCKVWCDAICINQEDIFERNREVGRMRDIYNSAYNVVAWLGDGGDGSDDAMDFINSIYQARLSGIKAVRHCLRETFIRQGASIWHKLSALITRPYFFRLWIIQEIVMGPRDTHILCGEKVTTWERMHQVYHGFSDHKATDWDQEFTMAFQMELRLGDPVVFEAYQKVLFWKWGKCNDFRTLQEAQEQNKSTNKRFLISRCRTAMCSNPLDKVYGILGILNPALSVKINPDYNCSVREAYMSFARAWIEVEGTLEVLTQCGESGENYQRDHTIPSWVPDLRQEGKAQLSNSEPTYNAHGQTGACATFIHGGTVLVAKGVLFDEIDGLSGVRHWDDDIGNFPDIQDSTKHESAYGTDDIALREALWRALIGNRDRFGYNASPSYSYLLDSAILDSTPPVGATDHWYNIQLWMKRNADFLICCNRPLKYFLQDNKAPQLSAEQYHQAINRMGKFLWSRRLVTTKQGYIGVVPRPVRRGDIVAVLFGCSAPLILRPCRDGYKDMLEIIASECYIQGIMDGEIVQGVHDEKKYLVREFFIR